MAQRSSISSILSLAGAGIERPVRKALDHYAPKGGTRQDGQAVEAAGFYYLLHWIAAIQKPDTCIQKFNK
jgi:hypothetical protein